MENRTLRYFLAVAREENMTAAANNLHISQPALSRSMNELEQELGTVLFRRTNRKTYLTEDGMRLRQRAEEIIALIDQTEKEFRDSDERITGTVHIGAGEGRSFSLIAEAMKNTQMLYPDITFSVHSANAIDVTERLERGTLDFGMLFHSVPENHYEILPLPAEETVGLIVPEDHPLAHRSDVTEEDLYDLPLLVSNRLSPDSVLTALSEEAKKKIHITATYNLLYNAARMVEKGMGCAVSFEHLVSTDEHSKLRFVPFEPSRTMRPVVVWKKERILTKAASAFLRQLQKVCSEQTGE